MKKHILAAIAAFGMMAGAAHATPVNWVDWNAATPNSATGVGMAGFDTVNVTETNSVNNAFVQTAGGTYYYTGTSYTDGVGAPDSAPPTSDIIALNQNGTVTINFDTTVRDVYLAIVSWNIPSATFSQDVEVINTGCGYFGCGTASAIGGTVSFSGEVHGVLKLSGDIDSFSFTHSGENWHGFTIGFAGLATPAIPLPASGLLLVGALGGVAALRRRKTTG